MAKDKLGNIEEIDEEDPDLDKAEKERIERIDEQETAKSKLIYDKRHKVLDPGKLRATNYKFHRYL